MEDLIFNDIYQIYIVIFLSIHFYRIVNRYLNLISFIFCLK